ncbi:hypothetical protein ACS0TY_023968 [Phlomoides rotata]
MDALESPLEALAFNYLTYGLLTAVKNIWARVAVITAAVSFWRIRFSSSTPEAAESAAEQPAIVSSSSELALSKASFSVLEREGSTKMKFTLYIEEGDDGGEDDGGEAAAVVSPKWWCDDWEKMMVMRMGDMGWYKWQDTTALDGSVVRLWERREAAALVVDGGVAW